MAKPQVVQLIATLQTDERLGFVFEAGAFNSKGLPVGESPRQAMAGDMHRLFWRHPHFRSQDLKSSRMLRL